MILNFIVLICFCSLINQIIFWKIFKPKNTGKSLLLILIFSNLLYFYIFKDLLNLGKIEIQETTSIIISILAFDLMYIFGFPPIEYPSPSVELVGLVRENKNFNIKKFLNKKKKENIVEAKIQQLLNEKYLKKNNDLYSLTLKGTILVKFFLLYKTLLKQNKGG
tara:strand:- start:56 stop:547 length:492 start_codon:yes stop_codon:yes gene_type:complete